MTTSPSAIVVDVNETRSDMSPMAQRSADLGADATLAELWFASLLGDGFALTPAGASRPFAELTPMSCARCCTASTSTAT